VDPAQREELEREIAAHCAAGEYAAATTIAIKGYGPEILGYLFAATKREQDTADIFSEYCENVWRGIPAFRGESTFRTWSYRLAYHALARVARTGSRRGKREVAMADIPEVEAMIDHVRTRTLPHMRTEVKQEVARLRESLDEDDRTLLILRVDRGLAWDEIAAIVDPEVADAEGLKRMSATLRKRFGRIKVKLRELSKGLVFDD
jgi:RNA polymerase sigma-70 factor (ECF subfamily)